MNKQETDKHTLDMALTWFIIAILICVLVIISIHAKQAQRDAIRKVNQQWVHELAKRGLVSLNGSGGIKFNEN